MRLGFIFIRSLRCLLLAVPLTLHPFANAQQSDSSSSVVRDTTLDGLEHPYAITLSGDTLHPPARSHKNPWLAVGLSAALPGAGQIYNQNYWKPPIIWGFAGYWIYEWFQNNNSYKDYRSQYAASISPNTPNGNLQIQQLRDFYRDERDKFAWYLGALYFLNLIDAYVSSSLFDFDVSSDLGMRTPSASPGVTATLRLKF